MKILIIGGNRFVGLRLSLALDKQSQHELHVVNRSGQVAHSKNAVVYKSSREDLDRASLARDWDIVVDFACFTGEEARAALKFFGNVGRYIFISTVSVYEGSGVHPESDFDAKAWKIQAAPDESQKENLYQFGKRQAEAVFTQEAPFPVAHIRFPFIMGPDDYTRRLIFHVDSIAQGRPIYLPEPKARISAVQSEDAARFLEWSLTQNFTGPLNVASPEPIALEALMALIGNITGRKAQLARTESEADLSPYGVEHDFAVNTDLLKKLGYTPKSLHSWLPELIRELGPDTPGTLH